MPDYVHLLVDIQPRISILNFMGYLKGKSSLMIFETTIRKYIREQENEDMMKDKLTKKEFINPFKGMLK